MGRARRTGVPDPVDIHVGKRLRLRRILLGLSQDMLGQAVGLTFQQIQKYERGANRIGASRLYDFTIVLDVPVSYFFDEMPSDIGRADADPSSRETSEDVAAASEDSFTTRESLELVRNYYAIVDPRARRSLYALIKSMARRTGDRTR